MKKSCFVILVVCCSFLFVSAASAGMYAGAKLGYVMTTDSDWSVTGYDSGDVEFDGGFAMGGFFGMTMDQLRVEGEIEYRKADIDESDIDGDLTTWSFLANGYYDIETGSAITPYVGGGIGMASHTLDVTIEGVGSGDETETVFAYQLSVGAAWAISPTMDLDCGYRYFATADPEFGPVDAEYASHNIYAGVRFNF